MLGRRRVVVCLGLVLVLAAAVADLAVRAPDTGATTGADPLRPGEMNYVLTYNFTDLPVQLYRRTVESAIVSDRGWEDLDVSRRGPGGGWTPHPGRYTIAVAPVGAPVSRAFARVTYTLGQGDHLLLVLIGSARERKARFIARPFYSSGTRGHGPFVRVWNVAPNAPAVAVEVAWDRRWNNCRRRNPGWTRIANSVRQSSVSRPARLAPGIYRVRVVTAGTPHRVLARGLMMSKADGSDLFIAARDGDGSGGRSGVRVKQLAAHIGGSPPACS